MENLTLANIVEALVILAVVVVAILCEAGLIGQRHGKGRAAQAPKRRVDPGSDPRSTCVEFRAMHQRIRFIDHHGKRILALIGTEDLPASFYDELKSYSRRDLLIFKTREEALDWLATDSVDA